MKKKYSLIFLGMLLVAISAFFIFQIYKNHVKSQPTQVRWSEYVIEEGEVRGYYKSSPESLFVYKSKPSVWVSSAYLAVVNTQIFKKSYQTGQYQKDDFVQLNIYQTDKNYPDGGRKIDLKKALSAYNDAYIYHSARQIRYLDKTKSYYLPVAYIDTSSTVRQTDDTSLQKKEQLLYFNLKTETFEEGIDGREDKPSNLGPIFAEEVSNLYDLTGKGAEIFIAQDFVHFNSDFNIRKIYTEYALNKHGVTNDYELYWFGKENSKDLAELLAKEGQTDIFYGVTLYGDYSKDGLDHEVKSYTEFMDWYQEPAAKQAVADPTESEH